VIKTFKLLIFVFSALTLLLLGGLYVYLKVIPDLDKQKIEKIRESDPTVQDLNVIESLKESDIKDIAINSDNSISAKLLSVSNDTPSGTAYKFSGEDYTYMYVTLDLPRLEGKNEVYEGSMSGGGLGSPLDIGHFYLDVVLGNGYNLVYLMEGKLPGDTLQIYKKAINDDGTLSEGEIILRGIFN